MAPFLLIVPSLTLAITTTPQGDDQILARYTLAGQDTPVTRDDVALEMAFHQRRRDDGRQGCEHLIDTFLVRAAATKAGTMPSDDDVRAFWSDLQTQIRAQGQDPMQMPIVRNSGEAALLRDLAITLAHERLVRKELELGPRERVTPEMLGLWLQDERKKHRIVSDPDELPVGTVARVGDQDIGIADLGSLLLRKADRDDQDHMIRQVVFLRSLQELAKTHAVSIDDADIDAELRATAEAARKDPRYGGIGFEQMLQAQGLTPKSLRQSRVFQAKALQKKVVAALHPDQALQAEIDADRQGVLARAGARRRLAVVYSRASDTPNELVPRTFAMATEHLLRAKERLAKETFENVARIESDDPGSKGRGGDLGWFFAASKTLPPAVIAAAFATPRDGVTEPIAAADGCYLIKVTDIEPDPTDDQIKERLRDQHYDALTRKIMADADLRRPDGTPFDGAPAK